MIKIFTNNTNRLHGLDHLRAIAIILVMIFHYGRGIPDWLEPIKRIGWTGVDLFFVLSGYLIGFQLLKEFKGNSKINLKRFYMKRLFRIVPAYLAVLILYYSLGSLREGSGLPPLWKFLTFTQNYGLDSQTQKSFSHAWSLCVEEQFYLLMPISIILFFQTRLQKLAPYFMLALIGIGILLRIYNWNEFVQPFIESGSRRLMVQGLLEKVYYPSHNRMDGLIVGVLIASIFNFKPGWKAFLNKYGNTSLLLGLILFLLAYQVCESILSFKAMVYGLPLISLAYGFIVIGAISPTSILYKLKSRFTFVIATLSYAIYLSHKQVYHFVKIWVTDMDNGFIQQNVFWICLILAVIGGLILYLFIEKPFMKLRDRILIGNEKKQEIRGKLILNYIKNIWR
ncbi:acyltransferase family protein [Marinifilum sp. D737]|uniref:acyltransferase family protein n=1 Tax=Marinifilum sp. D737 TaxID=2969628 RepID=UPI002274E774|nr:acyltransferase [Marinifilum sp. D737]MCY1635507.1 acyltransferase [Marinifilum sp. D737]